LAIRQDEQKTEQPEATQTDPGLESVKENKLVLELVDGLNLKAWVCDGLKLEENELRFLFKHQILPAINHCYSNNVCHGDIKPENFVMNKDGKVKLIDFGFAQRM
jgi:serine/threonine protein kinase